MYDEESGAQIFPINGEVEYAYTSSYENIRVVGSKLAGRAQSNLLGEKGNISSTFQSERSQAISQLESIQEMARTSENAFLAKYGFTSAGDNWSELITGLNKLLGTEASFKRNLNLLRQVAKGERKDYQDINRFLIDKIQDATYEVCQQLSVNMTGDDIAQLIIQKALSKLSQVTESTVNGKVKTNQTKDGEVLHAFAELYSNIQVIQGSAFFKGMVDLFNLNSYIEEVRNQLQVQQNIGTKERLEVSPKGKNYHGTLQELLDAAIGSSLHGSGGNNGITWNLTGQQVGGMNYKPDVILANVEVNYNAAAEEAKNALNTNSVRAKGIETMERLFKNMKDAKGDIVLISNKNYLINEMFKNGTNKRIGGFTAQGDTNLNNLSALFNAVHLPNVEGLVNYLASAGDGMLMGDVDNSVLDTIAARIGDFLFDDMEITPPSGLNVVHIFNLSGVYVPMSFILEGVKQGLNNLDNSNTLEDYVEVTFKSSPTEAPDWDATAFERFRKARMRQTTIAVHFMRDFAQIITSAVNI